MSTDELQRDVGRMEAELASLKASLDEMRVDVKEIKAELAEFRHCFAELKGGYKTLLGFAAVIGAALTQVVQYFLGKHT